MITTTDVLKLARAAGSGYYSEWLLGATVEGLFEGPEWAGPHRLRALADSPVDRAILGLIARLEWADTRRPIHRAIGRLAGAIHAEWLGHRPGDPLELRVCVWVPRTRYRAPGPRPLPR